MLIGQENTLAVYILLILGAVAVLALGYKNAKGKAKALPISLFLPLYVLLFSHIAYSLVNIEALIYDGKLLSIFHFLDRGYMLYGGLLGVVILMFIIAGKEAGSYLDSFASSVILYIAIFRIAEGFMGQGFGEPWYGEQSFITGFPFMIYDAEYESWAWAVFMLEAVVALIIFAITFKQKPLFQGEKFLLITSLYASAQIYLENIRADEFLRFGFVRIEQVISAIVILIAMLYYAKHANWRKESLVCLLLFAIFTIMAGLLQFAMEGRIPFLRFLSDTACYAVLAFISLLYCLTIGFMRSLVVNKN